jgi:signal transduction histidine kinase
MLSERGLAAALDALAERTSLPVELAVDVDERLPEPVEVTIFYVVSESLANIAKYAHASSAVVRVERGDDRILVAISDDGIGGADADRGTGLHGLADRLAVLDGSVEVESPPGRGTTVRAVVPMRPARDAWYARRENRRRRA